MSEDPDCLLLAKLASQAVDFQKSGTPAEYRSLPKERSQLKPDWYAGEGGREQDTYPSPHALGVLYRAISLEGIDVSTSKRGSGDLERVLTASKKKGKFLSALRSPTLLKDPISRRIQLVLECSLVLDERIIYEKTLPAIRHFSYQLRNLSYRMSLKPRPLTEEECWAGVIHEFRRSEQIDKPILQNGSQGCVRRRVECWLRLLMTSEDVWSDVGQHGCFPNIARRRKSSERTAYNF